MKAHDEAVQPLEAIRILTTEVIDYAGLFPPSQISMPEAVLNYATYRASNYGWMLGRFILPVPRLEEFLDSAGEFLSTGSRLPWRLSVLAVDAVKFVDLFYGCVYVFAGKGAQRPCRRRHKRNHKTGQRI
jgi:hypothetical protein